VLLLLLLLQMRQARQGRPQTVPRPSPTHVPPPAPCPPLPPLGRFDTVKVRLQTSYAGAVDSARSTLRGILTNEGLAGLYRGMSFPLAGTVLETSMLFTANGYLKRELTRAGSIPPGVDLPMRYVLLAGAGTGFCVSWVLTPIELIKCRMQVAGQPMDVSASASASGVAAGVGVSEARHPVFRGPLDCLARAVREDGLRVLYRGHTGTLLREIPGTACWFGAYETFIRAMTPVGKRREDLHQGWVIAAGALGGMAYWAVLYPADTVKSAMQTAGSEAGSGSAAQQQQQQQQPSFSGTLRAIYRAGGLRALYAGITPTVIRAAPSNAVIFWAYEESAKVLNAGLGLVE